MPNAPHARRIGARVARACPWAFPLTPALLAVLLLCPAACASGPRPEVFRAMRDVLADLDDFGALLLEAGLPPDMLPPGREVSPEEATRLRVAFGLYPPTSRTYGPRLVADMLLREVTEGAASVKRSELDSRLLRYRELSVMGSDGFLSSALTGTPAQCIGPVEVKGGALWAGEFEVGGFYAPDGNGGWLRVVFLPPFNRSL